MTETKVVTFGEMHKAEKLGAIAKVDGLTDEMREFLYKEIETLKKKNSYKSKADKEKDKENENIENIIVETLKGSENALSTTDIALVVGSKTNKYVSTQRITPRCKALVDNGKIEKVTEKGVNKYKAV